jgi:hypothetical protein
VDDVASGCVRYLAAFPDVTGLLGSFSNTDPVTANQGRPWIFNADPLVVLEGSSSAALVCSDFGGWQAPPQLGTWRFGRLAVQVYVDPARDSSRNITETSALTVNRGNAVFAAVQFRLQRTDPDTIVWGDLVTTGCQLLTDGPWLPVPDGDHLLVKQAFFGVSWSGWTDAAELVWRLAAQRVPAGGQLLDFLLGRPRGPLEVPPSLLGRGGRISHPADVERDDAGQHVEQRGSCRGGRGDPDPSQGEVQGAAVRGAGPQPCRPLHRETREGQDEDHAAPSEPGLPPGVPSRVGDGCQRREREAEGDRDPVSICENPFQGDTPSRPEVFMLLSS